eukprot:scaffold7760_cov101-Isochrysis_galbana.AAC.1
MEAEEVGAEKSPQDLPPHGKGAEHLEGWPGGVKEPADAETGLGGAEEGGEEHEVVVVTPDE